MSTCTREYCWRVRLRVHVREYNCEYSSVRLRVFSSLALASFDLRVGKASFACDIACNMSHTHTCVYTKIFCGGVKKVCGRPEETFSVRPKTTSLPASTDR